LRCLLLLSMTGFGNASAQNELFTTSVEIKTVNNRFLKVSMRIPDVLIALEPDIEKTVRKFVARGTVTGHIRFTPIGQAARYRLVPEVIASYLNQIDQMQAASINVPNWTDALMTLPGVVADELSESVDAQAQWPFVKAALEQALESLGEFRRREGDSMHGELTDNCQAVSAHLEQVVERAPLVVSSYRDKIKDRVNEILSNSAVTVEEENLIREVSIFADRCDINEEITRLKCHIVEFLKVMEATKPQGKKLDFLSQEMYREINTMGSKANDIEISHHVVDMKASVEKMREILANVE
jgi:uncharacterized protein (TIGR00255 family)